MTNLIRLIFFMAVFPLFAQQVNDNSEMESILVKGNTFYQNGEFYSAISEYEKIIEAGYVSESVYYNLGNAFFRTDQLGRSILNYERALKLDPGNEDVLYNLKIANARTIDKIEEVPQLYITRLWDTLFTSFSVNTWLIATLIVYVLLIIFIGLYLLHKRLRVRRFSFFMGTINLGLLLFVLIILLVRINRETSTDYGILIDPTSVVKVSPDIKSNDAFILHEGIKFEVEDKVNNWTKIKLVDGKVGWLPDDVLEQI